MDKQINGLLIIDKPEDFTSFDLCAKLRRLTGQRKIGHSGTLDPMATGVMVILLGTATRAADLMPDHTKEYIAGFRLGMTTDTLDVTGKVLSEQPADFSLEQLEDSLCAFRGTIEQLPPMYSAVHSNGRRLYELAREGLEVERTPRPVEINRLRLADYDPTKAEGALDVSCSKGTYIRTLIDDIGRAIGCGAVMTSLRRTRACGFGLEDAITLEQAGQYAEADTIEEHIIPTDRVFAVWPECTVTQKQAIRYQNGGELDLARIHTSVQLSDGCRVRVTSGGAFLGIGRIDAQAGLLWPHKRF